MHAALTSAAVQWCWGTAHLYDEQISLGLLAVTRACCQVYLQSTLGQ